MTPIRTRSPKVAVDNGLMRKDLDKLSVAAADMSRLAATFEKMSNDDMFTDEARDSFRQELYLIMEEIDYYMERIHLDMYGHKEGPDGHSI